ncbi:MAG: hypothetical protein AVDCRST_MAG88-3394 [uncultured Thermomicrobiales bacterium]|uniref:ThuA-like domain-containing protein n=1 Tax=uncultured Thermomicrobiales bacterium TaxID=1645740 RepID=A0A6J4VLF0_9BACT|nr:MAG: hypothetical protein AVDCRST_MAG88-3394 [uncultured Thermomicrobiales bacterium]
MRALVLCDDYWHPARTVRAGLAPLESAGLTFDWIEHAGAWSAERMAEYPVVVLAKANHVSASDREPWVTGEVQDAFRAYIRRGNGLLAIHSGTAGYRHLPVLRGVLGGVFISHPPQCPVTVAPREGHPLAMGSMPFTQVDEHYMMELDDPEAEVILTTTSEHGAQAGGWTRAEGDGRVCVLTPGHNLPVWLHPAYQVVLLNALRWCGGLATG